MKFTYQSYQNLIVSLQQHNYRFVTYSTEEENNKSVILRHDVDNSLQKAAVFAKYEEEILKEGKSTYFILLSSDFYNIASKSSRQCIEEILEAGHDIGLHFDELAYFQICADNIVEIVENEAQVMRRILGIPIQSVSMHRPSTTTLEANYQFETLVNSYSKRYFNEYKYLSDSRMHWREDVLGIIESQQYSRLHILTHPFWYSEQEITMMDHIGNFIKAANSERYRTMKDNIRNIDEIISKEECL